MATEKQLTVSLAESVTETVAEEVAGGIIAVSENTRLGVIKGTATKRLAETTLETTVSGAPPCGGVVTGPGGAMAAYFKPATGTKRITTAGVVETVASTTKSGAPQNAYFPLQVSGAGSVSGARSSSTPVVIYDSSGRKWIAAVRALGTGWAVYVTVMDGDEVVVTTRAAVTLSTAGATLPEVLWVGFTKYQALIQLWYADDTGVNVRHMQVGSGNTLTVGSATLVYSPVDVGLATDVCYDSTHAYLITENDTVNTTVTITKVTLATLATAATRDIASVGGLNLRLAISAYNGRLAIAISAATANATFGVIDTATMTGSLGTTAAETFDAGLAIQPYVQGGTSWFLFAMSAWTGTPLTAPARTLFFRMNASSGAWTGSSTLYWMRIQGRGAYHEVSSSEVYPYFTVVPMWTALSITDSPAAYGSTPSGYVADPSVDVYTPCAYTSGSTSFTMTPVARVGAYMVTAGALAQNSGSAAIGGGKLLLSYALRDKFRSSENSDYGSRWVELDLEPEHQPGVAVTPGGVGLVAAALPVCWDGVETTEAGWLHAPRVWVEDNAGDLSAPTMTGSYLFSAVITRYLANGKLVRSAPALPYPVTLAAERPKVHVSLPATMRNGVLQEEYTITVYLTQANGTVLYASSMQSTATTGGRAEFDFVGGDPLGTEAPLYTDGTGGQLLVPVCPPAATDARTIGARVWLLDGERMAVWPSQEIDPDVAIEFAAELALYEFDPQYGKLLAIVDLGGVPHVLAERGVWVIDGYGPDAVGRGGAFAVRLVSGQGCRGRHTVAVLPGVGVMMQGQDGRFVLLGDGGAGKRFDTIAVYDVCTPTVFADTHEVIYPLQDGGWIVYDWVMDAWTHWTPGVSP